MDLSPDVVDLITKAINDSSTAEEAKDNDASGRLNIPQCFVNTDVTTQPHEDLVSLAFQRSSSAMPDFDLLTAYASHCEEVYSTGYNEIKLLVDNYDITNQLFTSTAMQVIYSLVLLLFRMASLLPFILASSMLHNATTQLVRRNFSLLLKLSKSIAPCSMDARNYMSTLTTKIILLLS